MSTAAATETLLGDDAEAVELANATEYGLAAAVQSGSRERGERLAEQLRAGMVHVNDHTVNEEAPAPVRRLRLDRQRVLRRQREPGGIHALAVADLARPRPPVPVLEP